MHTALERAVIVAGGIAYKAELWEAVNSVPSSHLQAPTERIEALSLTRWEIRAALQGETNSQTASQVLIMRHVVS